MWFFWPAYGRPKIRQNTITPQTIFHKSCREVCSASLDLGDGLIDVAFEDDTFWFRDETSNDDGDGIAVVKAGLRVQKPVERLLSMVECETTFSQPSGGQFQGVHSCWPAHPQIESHGQQRGHDSSSSLPAKNGGSEQQSRSQKSERSIPAFVSHRRLSKGTTSGTFDTVKHTLYMWDETYLVASQHSKYHGAFVLRCANSPLIVTTSLKAFETRACPDLGTVRSLFAQVKTSIQFGMTARDAGVTLCAPCIEVERWVDTKNSITPLEERSGSNCTQAESENNRAINAVMTVPPECLPGLPKPNFQGGLSDPSKKNTCTSVEWFDRLHKEVHPVLMTDVNAASGVKVAIVDTGAHFNKSQYKSFHRQHISGCRTWCDATSTTSGRSFMDEGGNIAPEDVASDLHGTHSLSVLRKVAPNCTIFVAQVFRGRDDIVDRYPSNDQAQRIANAIDYAVTEERADIISMSFGFRDEVPVIRDAIDRAATRASKPCLLFAAASNFALNEDVQWPASHDRVICVHATDGLGNKYARNVTPEQPWKEFATLGCDVEAFIRPGHQAIKSGTSVASPVAAGIAALILGEACVSKAEYLTRSSRDPAEEAKVYDEKLYRLRTREGMSKVLMSMSRTRDGYNCLRPWMLLHKDYGHKCFRVEKIMDTAAGGKPVHVSTQS